MIFYLFFPRKEVIQPHLPIRLPCYDFTPVIGPAFGSSFFAVRSLTSGVTDSHGVTGGVYKTRESAGRGSAGQERGSRANAGQLKPPQPILSAQELSKLRSLTERIQESREELLLELDTKLALSNAATWIEV